MKSLKMSNVGGELEGGENDKNKSKENLLDLVFFMPLLGKGRGPLGLPSKTNWKWVSLALGIIYLAYTYSLGYPQIGFVILIGIILVIRWAK